jgi:hypothetical protein
MDTMALALQERHHLVRIPRWIGRSTDQRDDPRLLQCLDDHAVRIGRHGSGSLRQVLKCGVVHSHLM